MPARQHVSRRCRKVPAIALVAVFSLPALLAGCFDPPGPVATVERVVDGRRLNANIRPAAPPELKEDPRWESPGVLKVQVHRRQAGTCDQEKLRQQVRILREERIYFRKVFEEGPVLTALDSVLKAIATIGSFGAYDVYKITKLLEDKAEDDEAGGLIGGPWEYFHKIRVSRNEKAKAIEEIRKGVDSHVCLKEGLYGKYSAKVVGSDSYVERGHKVDEVVSLVGVTLQLKPVDAAGPLFTAVTDAQGQVSFDLGSDRNRANDLVPGTYGVFCLATGDPLQLATVEIDLDRIAAVLRSVR